MAVFWVVEPFYQTTRRYNPEDSQLHYEIPLSRILCFIASTGLLAD
jgi:hypothetical protein